MNSLISWLESRLFFHSFFLAHWILTFYLPKIIAVLGMGEGLLWKLSGEVKEVDFNPLWGIKRI